MTKQAELRNLLEQVVNAEGPSRELDARIELVALERSGRFPTAEAYHTEPEGRVTVYGAEWKHIEPAAKHTASLDAALAFKDRMLPGWDYEVGSCGPHMVGDRAAVWDCYPEDGGDPRRAECPHAANAALALVAAVLKAFIEQESE